MKLSKLNIKKINFNDIDINYSSQDILMKLGELYQFESGIYGYGNIWTKLERNIEKIIIEELDKADCVQVEFTKLQPRSIWDKSNRWNQYTEENDIMFHIKNNFGEYGWLQLQKNAPQYLDQIDCYHTSNYQQHIIKLEKSLEKK